MLKNIMGHSKYGNKNIFNVYGENYFIGIAVSSIEESSSKLTLADSFLHYATVVLNPTISL